MKVNVVTRDRVHTKVSIPNIKPRAIPIGRDTKALIDHHRPKNSGQNVRQGRG